MNFVFPWNTIEIKTNQHERIRFIIQKNRFR